MPPAPRLSAGLATGASLAVLALTASPALAQDAAAPSVETVTLSGPQAARETDAKETIVVYGRAIDLTGEAQSASEGVVGYADFETRPILRPGELVEVIPGMVAAQHSGGGKANQYFLRGFNLDHGTDFAGSFDGVPLNLRAHPHMNGYLDINFMIPELVEKVAFHKGTAYAPNGDFSAAGSADFTTYDVLPNNFVEADISDDGDYRALAAGTLNLGDAGHLTAALQHDWGDGPFDRPDELDKTSGYMKYVRQMDSAKLHVAFLGYSNSWYATDQIPVRAYEQGLIGRFGSLDDDLGGDTSRYILSAGLDWSDASVLVYGQSYKLKLYNNPTFWLDQVNGDEFVQVADRTALGARGKINRSFEAGVPVDVRLGADVHTDFIDESGLYRTIDRQPFETIRSDDGTVTLADVWMDATFHLTDKLRVTPGARVDHIIYDFTAIQPENSGDGSDSKFSPKLSAAYAFSDALEAYASYGYAFHTNDARGALLTVDPASGDPVDPVDVFVESRGGEIGMRYQPTSSFNVAGSVFTLDLDSELIFVGDAGTSEPSDPTRRSGIEIATFWQPVNWLALDASGAWSHSRFRDAGDADRIPNAVDFVGSFGATATFSNGWEGSLRGRYIGESALIEDNSVRGDPTFSVNLGVAKDFGPFYVGLDVLNLLDSSDSEIQYYYESQLQGEAAPVEDRFIHPLHPRSFRAVLRAKF